jgi:ribosomal protein L18
MAYSIKRKKNSKAVARRLRHQRVRKRISGTPQRPRLVVTRSNRHMVAQLVDDTVGHTLCSASTLEKAIKEVEAEGHKVGAARRVGELVAERARALGIESIVFDRAGYKYHGRVAAVAEGAREGGLVF